MAAPAKTAPVQTEMVAVASITPHPKNPRTHPDAQVAALAAAFDEFDIVVPPILDEKNRLIAGEGRWLAAKKKGIAALPCIVVRGWSEKKKLRFMVADNRLPQLGGFDDETYRAVLNQIKGDGLLEALGFDDATLAELLAVPNNMLVNPDEIVPPKPKKAAVRRGDVWNLGEHRIICGDATKAEDVAAVLQDAKPNLMVTDPPYGVKYDPLWREGLASDMNGSTVRVEKAGKVVNRFRANATGNVQNDDRADWTEAWNLFKGDVAYVWHGGLHAGTVEANLITAGFAIRAQIVWVKQNQVFSRGDYHWKHEPCWYAVRKGGKGWWRGDRKQTTVWEIQNHNPMGGNKEEEQTGHGTQKPIECMRRPIQNNSRKGEAVYEPFAGSGTTIIAAEMTGRKCLAIEIDPGYVQVCIERWQKATGKLALLDGKTLEQVAAARRRGRAKGATDDKQPRTPPAGDRREPVRRARKKPDHSVDQPST